MFFGDEGLHPRVHTRKGADGAGHGAGGELGMMAGEFQAEGGGFGMDAVAAGMVPRPAIASAARASISNQMRKRSSGDQMATIAGRE